MPLAFVLASFAAFEIASSGSDGDFFGELGEPTTSIMNRLMLAVLIGTVVITMTSIWFNFPKWYVPAAFRKDRGLLSWLYGRRG